MKELKIVTAFVLVGGYGEMYRTTDHGRTWQFLPALTYPDFKYVQYLSLSPDFAVDHTLTAHPGMLRSTDGGDTWVELTRNPGLPTGVLGKMTIAVSPADPNRVWAITEATNGGLYRSDDGGETWTISSTPFSGGDLSFIDVNNGWMLADLGVGAGSNAVAVFQTKDGGATWTQTYTNDPNEKDAGNSLPLGGLKSDLLPLNMQTAWVGGVIYTTGTAYLYRTEDGGHTWIHVKLELPPDQENAELDIAGNGQFRGGDGILREIEFLTAVRGSILSDRRRFSPYGLAGGDNGKPGRNSLTISGRTTLLPSKSIFEAPAGSVLRIETPGGGGWGKRKIKRQKAKSKNRK